MKRYPKRARRAWGRSARRKPVPWSAHPAHIKITDRESGAIMALFDSPGGPVAGLMKELRRVASEGAYFMPLGAEIEIVTVSR